MTDLTDIKSITPQIAAKLQGHNIFTVEVFATITLNDLMEKLKGVSEEQIRKVQEEVWRKLGTYFTTADELRSKRPPELIMTTGSSAIDDMLKNPHMEKDIEGGIRSQTISEFVGGAATGKTEFIHNIVSINLERHKDWGALVFDTESTFSEMRLADISVARGFDYKSILKRTIIVPIWHTQHFETMIDNADVIIKTRNIRIICIDSLVGSIRAEKIGREELASRQQTLSKILRKMLNFARAFNLAVVLTNQISDRPEAMFTYDPVELHPPAGGNIVGHNDNIRVYLRKASGMGQRRIARLIDACCFPPGERPYLITGKGIEDVPDWKEVSTKLMEKAKMVQTIDVEGTIANVDSQIATAPAITPAIEPVFVETDGESVA